jgi:hypothetical protein
MSLKNVPKSFCVIRTYRNNFVTAEHARQKHELNIIKTPDDAFCSCSMYGPKVIQGFISSLARLHRSPDNAERY